MAILVSAHQLRKAYAARPLFQSLTFSVESGERIGLIGPNGAGKSTLLRILAGQTGPDDGTLSLQKGLRVGFLEQVPSFKPGSNVFTTVLEGTPDPDDWECQALASELMSKLSLDPEALIDSMSGGWKKRVALARELARKPDLLLLDEPTNHLDVESILWLEDLLARAPFATLTITHDRLFLQRISNRIIELDPRNAGGLLSVKGDYSDYLETKEQLMAAQQVQETRLKNTLRRETEWLRRGAKARTTKQQSRINRHGELSDQVDELSIRNRERQTRIEFQATEKNPKKLIEAKGISKSYGSRKIFPPTDLLITPKSRIGLIGANGCGKSTFIKVLLGQEKSDTGTIMHSEHLKVAYFEQNRETLDPNVSLAKTICPVGEYVDYRGGRVHIRSYLDRFLFSQGQFDMAVGKLSGGEQSRLLIAKLMLQEANVLVLDEPTNDLDVATLDVLQGVLQDFAGAVFLVTHDRYFLDQVADQLLAFPGDGGKITTFVGLEQWEAWHDEQEAAKAEALKAATKAASVAAQAAKASGPKRKLSFNEQREFDSMEANIQKAEAELERLQMESVNPANATNAIKLAELTDTMAKAQAEVDRLYSRWSELGG